MSDEAQPSKVTLRVGDSEGISPRRINPEDLAAINRELRNFSVNVEWKISDELGEHAGDDLDSVLKNVIWETVQGFDCSAYIDTFTSLIRIFENMGRRLTISWESDAGPHRESAERTYKKTLLLLEHLPEAQERNIYTTKAAEQQRLDKEEALLAATRIQTTKEPDWWWRRARRAAPAWLIAFVTAIAASLVAGGILLLIFA